MSMSLMDKKCKRLRLGHDSRTKSQRKKFDKFFCKKKSSTEQQI